jgi:hypothetical protein
LPSGMADPQMLPTPIQLVKLQLHRQLLCDGQELLWTSRHRVLLARRGKCVSNCFGIRAISPELVLRGVQQECSHNPNEISPLDPELVLREVPGKLA